MKISAKKRREAVTRVLADLSTVKDECQRLGVNRRTFTRWIDAARDAAGMGHEDPSDVPLSVPSDDMSHGVHPPGTMSHDVPSEPSDALRAALNAASGGGNGTDTTPGPTPAEVSMVREDMAAYCLDTIGQLKQAAGGVLITFKYSPPLELASHEVQKLLQVGPLASAAIRANCQTLYPLLLKWMSGSMQLYGALALDVVLSFIAIHGLATSKGWETKKQDKPQGGSPATLKDQIEAARAAFVPTPIEPAPFTAEPPKPGTSINAPPVEAA